MPGLLKWFLLLNKRLYKKISFVFLLFFILGSVCVYAILATQESGFLQIALVRTDKEDTMSAELVQKLLSEESVILFTEVDGAEKAIDMVAAGELDSAWIFPADMAVGVETFVTEGTTGAVTVVEREQTVFLRLSHEKLSGLLYERAAEGYYVSYIREELPELDGMDDKKLMQYFHERSINKDLFLFGNPGEGSAEGVAASYLTAPLRGLLSVLIVLGGMAAVLYYMQDEKRQTFGWVPQRKRPWVAVACVGVATLNVTVAVLIALMAVGMSTSLLIEMACGLLYALCCAAFCLALKSLFGSTRLYGAIIPVLMVTMIGVCPVFFTLQSTMKVSLLFPPTYYINAAYNKAYLGYMVLYTVVCLAVYLLLGQGKLRRR